VDGVNTASAPEEATPAPPARRPAKVLRTTGRFLKCEGLVSFYFGLAISVVFNLRVVLHPKSLINGDLGDTALWIWELGWQHHWLTNGGDFWTSNQFYPSPENYAFGETLLGYFPFSVFAGDGQYANAFIYNVVFVFCFALAFSGAYLLAKQLGSTWQGAALAGAVWAWAPWRISHVSHVNLLSTGGIALALWALAKGHGYTLRGERTETKPAWVVAGWLIAAWQAALGWAIGLPFVYLMGVVGIVLLVHVRSLGRRLIIADAVGAVAFLGIVYWLVVPFLRVREMYGFKRTWEDVQLFSPPVSSLWTGPHESWLWDGTIFGNDSAIPGEAVGEKLLFPGLAAVVLGLLGLFVSVWTRKSRTILGVSVLVTALLALGVTFLDGDVYRLLWAYLPGWDAMRTPGRMIIWTTLALAILAAGTVTKLGQLLHDRTQVALQLIAIYLLVPAIFAVVEGIPVWQQVENPGIPPDVERVFTTTREPIALLPMDRWSDFKYQLWSTEGFPKTANGATSNYAPEFLQMQDASKSFPDQHSIDMFKRYGIRKIVVVKAMPGATDILARPTSTLPLTRTESADVVEFAIQ